MKHLASLKKKKALKPRQTTIDFILAYSKNLSVLKTRSGSVTITKN